jgi:hypothetical protein
MSIKSEIFGALTTILGTGVSVYQMNRPTTNYNMPCVIFNQISTGPNNTKDGASITDDSRFQINIYSTSSTGVNSISETIRNGFDYYSGGNIQKAFFQDQQDLDFTMIAGTFGEYSISQDYIVRFNR